MNKNKIACIIAIVLVLLFFGCANDESSERNNQYSYPIIEYTDDPVLQTLGALGINAYENINPVSASPDALYPEWTKYSFDVNDCKCISGAEYSVYEKKSAISNNVIFYLQGGGACWPGQDFCTKEVGSPGDSSGMYSSNEDNPLKNWNVVYVPYCDGSIHMGDASSDDAFYWGFRNTSAAVNVLKEQYPSPDKILIAGCSAGGYGSFISYMLIRYHFPNIPLYIYNESGPGIWNPDDPDTLSLVL